MNEQLTGPPTKPIGKLTPVTVTIAPKDIQIPTRPVGKLTPVTINRYSDPARDLDVKPSTEENQIAKTWGNEPSVGKYAYEKLAAGSSKLGAMLAKTPEFLIDVGLNANDAIVNNIAGTNQETTAKSLGWDASLPGMLANKVANWYEGDAEKRVQSVQQKYDKGVSDYFANGEYEKGFGSLAGAIAETAPITIGLMMANAAGVPVAGSILGGGAVFGAGKKSELEANAPHLDNSTKMNIALSNGLFEGIFEQFGITKLGSITRQVLKNEGKEAAKKIAKEGFQKVYSPVAKKYLGIAAEESIGEAATQFAQNAVDKYSGYKPELDLRDGVADAAIIGLGAAGVTSAVPATLETANKIGENKEAKKIIEVDAAKTQHAFEISQKGEDAVRVFKENVNRLVGQGKMTKPQADDAILRVNAFKQYNDVTSSFQMPDEQKLEVFDKSFQKQRFESQLEQMGDPVKLNPIEQGQYHSIKKQADDLQKDINDIIHRATIKEEPTVAKKTVEDIEKKDQKIADAKKPKDGKKPKPLNPVLQAMVDKYKSKVTEEEKPAFDIAEKSYEDVPVHVYNSNSFDARKKHEITSDMLAKQPNQEAVGEVVQRTTAFRKKSGKPNTVFGIKLPGGKTTRFSSSTERGDQWGRGHLRWETLAKKDELTGFYIMDEKDLIGKPVAMKRYEIPADEQEPEKHPAKPVIKVYSKEPGVNYGKFVGWAKATNTGQKKEFSDKQVDQLIDLELKKEEPPKGEPIQEQPTAPINTPEGQSQLEQIALKSAQTQPLPENNVQQDNQNLTNEQPAENTTQPTQPAAGGIEETNREIQGNGQTGKVSKRKGTARRNQKIKDESRKKALSYDVFSPMEIAMQYFIGNGLVSTEAIKKLYGKRETTVNDAKKLKGELFDNARNYVVSEAKGGLSVDQIAHDLWEENQNLNFDTSDYRNAVEEIIGDYQYRGQIAEALIKSHSEGNDDAQMRAWGYNPEMAEALMNTPAEDQNRVDDLIGEAEPLSDDALQELANDQDAYNEWLDVMRSQSPQMYAEYQIKQLRERGEYDPAIDRTYRKFFESKFSSVSDGQFQKKAFSRQGDVFKVASAIKKAMPRMKVEFDYKLNSAGKLTADGKTILINPYYAGIDTPIHEAGHVLIDAMGGMENKVIVAAIKQLKDTALWNEIKEAYPELSEENLGKEVLAEAIGREGAGIFTEQSAKNQFRAYLEYFFDWIRRKLGLDKNIAKSLAKQIISGVKTKNLTGENTNVEQKQKKKFPTKEFNNYREEKLGRDVKEEKRTLRAIEDMLENEENLSDEDTEQLNDAREAILADIEEDKAEFKQYRKDYAKLLQIGELTDFEGEDLNDLLQAYNNAQEMGEEVNEVKLRLADYLNHTGIQRLKEVVPNIDEQANSTDMRWWHKWMKVLSDVSQKFPSLQELSKEFDRRWVKSVNETAAKKKELERLGKAVIREKNGLLGKVSDVFNSDSAKYFEYLDDGGKLRTNTDGLTKAQKGFLAYMQNLVKDRKTLLDDDKNIVDNTLIRTDKGFWETFKSEGYKGAWGHFLKNFSRDEKRITANGSLKSRFDKPYKGTSYSKDFYKAAGEFIEENTYINNMKDLIPIVDGIELFYKKIGAEENKDFSHLIEFIEQWKTSKLYRLSGVTDPTLDMSLKALRKLTSATTMAFNVPANALNVVIGNYNAWREDGAKTWVKGQLRFFADIKKGVAVAKHYDVVSHDYDSNPKIHAGMLFDALAYAGMRWGETQIQASQFIGKMEAKEWNAFSLDKDGNLVITPPAGMSEKEFADVINSYRNEVSDVQGKYSEKDRRNFMNFEAGKAAAQFRVYIPDWIKTRFGAEFVDSHGKVRRGSFNYFTDRAIKELKADLKSGDLLKGKNKQTMQNLRGAMVIAVLLIAVHGDDDEDKKRKRKALSLDNALGSLLFIFDPQQLKWTFTERPAAAVGTAAKFIDALDGALKQDGKKFSKNAKSLIPYNKISNIPDAFK